MIFCVIFWLGFLMDFLRLLAAFWDPFWWIVGGFFGTFPDFAEKAAPHESTANSSQIEGRAPEKGRKNYPTSE